jgi:site-specific recombinase XerD
LRTYALGIAHFLEWLAARAVRLVDVGRGDVVAYVGEFARSEVDGVPVGRAAATVNHRVSVLASFLAWLIERDQIAGEPVAWPGEPGAAGIDGHDRRTWNAWP